MGMFDDGTITDQSKILITNSMGRSGTTLLQKMLCREHGLRNLNEPITFDDTRPETIARLAADRGWVCKFFVEVDTVDRFDHQSEIASLAPDVIFNAYREDRLDQFLSFQLSVLNGKWNADVRMEYERHTMDDPAGRIGYFLRSLSLYSSLLDGLRVTHRVVDISYEQIAAMVADGGDHGVAKQNTFEQKLDLVCNIDEVLAEWSKLTGETHPIGHHDTHR